ncbi:MAG: hypothetical protein NVS3B20_08860 [Polyangiales bacterium]
MGTIVVATAAEARAKSSANPAESLCVLPAVGRAYRWSARGLHFPVESVRLSYAWKLRSVHTEWPLLQAF